MSSTNDIKAQVETFLIEDEKFTNGNASAGTRARKALMEIKKLADDRRKEIQAEQNAK